MRQRAADLGCRLVFAQAFIDDLAQQVVLRLSQIFDLGDKLGPHPMYAAEDERGAEPAGAWRRDVERAFKELADAGLETEPG